MSSWWRDDRKGALRPLCILPGSDLHDLEGNAGHTHAPDCSSHPPARTWTDLRGCAGAAR